MVVKKYLKKISLLLHIFVLLAGLSVYNTACKKEEPVGEIDHKFPISFFSYETGTHGKDEFAGIVYRKVNDIEALIARSDKPILFVFVDDSPYTHLAISHAEGLADKFREQMDFVKVFVEISHNPEEVDKLISMFSADEFPLFAFVKSGLIKGKVAGISSTSKEKLSEMIYKNLK